MGPLRLPECPLEPAALQSATGLDLSPIATLDRETFHCSVFFDYTDNGFGGPKAGPNGVQISYDPASEVTNVTMERLRSDADALNPKSQLLDRPEMGPGAFVWLPHPPDENGWPVVRLIFPVADGEPQQVTFFVAGERFQSQSQVVALIDQVATALRNVALPTG